MGSKLDMGHKSTIQKVSQGRGGKIEKKRLKEWEKEHVGEWKEAEGGSWFKLAKFSQSSSWGCGSIWCIN